MVFGQLLSDWAELEMKRVITREVDEQITRLVSMCFKTSEDVEVVTDRISDVIMERSRYRAAMDGVALPAKRKGIRP